MNIVGIIPARMASTRFPNKPLASIMGMPMIGHVFLRSKMSKLLKSVYIATCDQEVIDYAVSIGAQAIMTKDTHERASDRTAEAMLKIEAETVTKVDIVVMIQGDEPMLHPEMIDKALEPMLNSQEVNVANLMTDLQTIEEENDPNEVKVVVDRFNNAIYFSREPIPSKRKGMADFKGLKQVCIIPFRRDFLLKFNEMEQTPLEIIESVDMLRLIENGYKVKMVYSNHDTYSVDTTRDLKIVEEKLESDALMKSYIKRGKDS
jgi:3-deoxy-manno-octulosonate cytidylyltransferase (CMP-KDO synthetase)